MKEHKPQLVPSSTSGSLRIVLALLSLPGMGRKTAHRLLAGQDCVESLEVLLQRQRGKTYDAPQIEQAYAYAEKTLERSEREGIRVLSFFDSNFPLLLKSIDDPPLLLHLKGDLAALKSKVAVAIIGTREPTTFGEQSARRIAATVAKSQAIVVSGLARGCDAAAHWGCIEAKGKTVAVLAHGLDKVYPAENKSLAEEILATSGCLVSEYEIGQRAFKNNFVDRDRLQSGLSQAVIVIETSVVGGSMHTVRFAIQQKRIVACIKHPPNLASEDKVQGNKKLIDEGQAIPLESSEEVELLLEKLHHIDAGAEEISATKPSPPQQLSIF